jgi:hypothetical protein
MKRTIFVLAFTAMGLFAKAQVDFTVSPFLLLVPSLQASVEYNINPNWGIGGDMFAGEEIFFIYASGRHFFNPDKGADKFNIGAYAGGAGGGNDSGFGLGFFFGYKAVSVKKVVFDFALGGGRDFTDNIGFLPYFKLNVGYRFGLLKE